MILAGDFSDSLPGDMKFFFSLLTFILIILFIRIEDLVAGDAVYTPAIKAIMFAFLGVCTIVVGFLPSNSVGLDYKAETWLLRAGGGLAAFFSAWFSLKALAGDDALTFLWPLIACGIVYGLPVLVFEARTFLAAPDKQSFPGRTVLSFIVNGLYGLGWLATFFVVLGLVGLLVAALAISIDKGDVGHAFLAGVGLILILVILVLAGIARWATGKAQPAAPGPPTQGKDPGDYKLGR